MKKTTLYIDDKILQMLKEEAIKTPKSSMTKIINNALEDYLERKNRRGTKHKYLKEAYGSSEAFKKAADPVEFQRKLRAEWD